MSRVPRDHGRVCTVTLLVVCLVPIGLVGQRFPAAGGMGRISGRVLSSSSEPIPGATVTLVLLPRAGEAITSWTTTTGADGTYRFEQLAEGPYTVTVSKPGYAGAIPSLTENVGAGFSGLGSANRRVDLQRDGNASEINLTMQRPGSISGRVFAANGAPVAGFLVMMHMRGEDGHSIWQRSLGRTDAQGRYRTTEAPLGTYAVGRQGHSGPMVTVAEGAVLEDVDVHLIPPPSVVTLRGQIVDETGAAPRGLQIEYGNPGSRYQALHTVNDPEGRFTISDDRMQPGPIAVFASADTDAGAAVFLDVIDAVEGINDVYVVVGKPGALRGRVIVDRSMPTSIQLLLTRLGFTPLGLSDHVVAVAPDGWFEADGLIGEYRVDLRAPAGWIISAIRRRGQTLKNVVLVRGELLDDVEVVIARGRGQ